MQGVTTSGSVRPAGRTDVGRVDPKLSAAVVVVGVVLRWWSLGGPALTADEQFTGVVAGLGPADLVRRVIDEDVHPPLDYLLRAPVAPLHDAFWLRAPSAVLSTLTLLFVWRWLRGRGWFGFAAITITAVLPYFLLYGRTARMYSALILLGTLAFGLADSWQRESRRWHPIAMGALVAGALLLDTSALLLALGAFLLPGTRRDRDAWWWRLAVVAGAGLWAIVWAPSLRAQTANPGAEWIPLTSFDSVSLEVGRLVSLFYPQLGIAAIVAVGFGAWCLWGADPPLGRLVVWVTAVPTLVAVVAATRLHILVARSFASVAFGVVLALAAAVEWARVRGYVLVAVLAVALLVLPSVRPTLTFEEDTAAPLRALDEQVAPGDVVVMNPGRLGHMVSWTLDAPPVTLDDDIGTGAAFVRDPEAARTGRTWVLAATGWPWAPDAEPCPGAPGLATDEYSLRCYQTGVA